MPRNVINQSVTVKNLLVDLGLDDQETTNADAIPLQNVDSKTLAKVIAWCTYHVNDPPKVEGVSEKEDLSSWDKDFLRMDQEDLFELILAANYLDIEGLLDAGCKVVADMMKGKSPEEIRKQFNITNDHTPEDEERIRKENAWAEG